MQKRFVQFIQLILTPRNLPKLIAALSIFLVILIMVASSCDNQTPPAVNNPTTEPSKLVILPNGGSTCTLEYGAVYEDTGATVQYDGLALDVPVVVQIPDMPDLGQYTVVYTASYNGETVTAQRIVTVVDTTPPEIVLHEVPGYCVEIGSEYEEEGYTATDNHDGDLTDQVIRTVEGEWVIYQVTDASGNVATAKRKIEYGDTTAPVITLIGGDSITIQAGDTFDDPGFIATDSVDGDLTDKVKVSGSYDKYQPGTYTYTYSVTDAHGNTATVKRQIIVQGAKQPDVQNPDGKVIYLTFDDGPSKYTADLLAILKKYNVKATFFVVGTSRLDYLDEIAADGHAIGIHSNTHVLSDIYASEDAFFDDFFKLYDKIYERTGIRTDICRFPGGTSNTASAKYNKGIMTRLSVAVPALGFQYFDWNVDSNDAGGAKTAEEVYQNVINGVSKRDVSVVLQHDIKKYSVEAVEKIIQWGLANGYTFLPLSSDSPPCQHKAKN